MERSDTGTLAKRCRKFWPTQHFHRVFFLKTQRDFAVEITKKNMLEKSIENCKCLFLFNLSTLCSPRFIRQELHLLLGRKFIYSHNSHDIDILDYTFSKHTCSTFLEIWSFQGSHDSAQKTTLQEGTRLLRTLSSTMSTDASGNGVLGSI